MSGVTAAHLKGLCAGLRLITTVACHESMHRVETGRKALASSLRVRSNSTKGLHVNHARRQIMASGTISKKVRRYHTFRTWATADWLLHCYLWLSLEVSLPSVNVVCFCPRYIYHKSLLRAVNRPRLVLQWLQRKASRCWQAECTDTA